ncbi:hypothetical protein MPSEU_000309200 [Mayamaea pseudoterrestris]|nr:hypothetical protein MPSEU_000309200 [Mayamaea pseudoterrestris]
MCRLNQLHKNKSTMASSLCDGSISSTSKRSLLAALWTLVTILSAVSFIVALIFTLSAREANKDYDDDEYARQGNDNNDNGDDNVEMAVTSRAMAFCALWTAVLTTLMAIFGTVILGWQSPTGVYYTCCSSRVHKTTPLALGSFIGALIMFANLTLVCSVLFGEFEIRDYQREGEPEREQQADTAVRRSSLAFSIMCMVLTVLYAGFAALTFAWSKSILQEMAIDIELEDSMAARSPGKQSHHFVVASANTGYDGYIGERFDVRTAGFVGAPVTAVTSNGVGTMT